MCYVIILTIGAILWDGNASICALFLEKQFGSLLNSEAATQIIDRKIDAALARPEGNNVVSVCVCVCMCEREWRRGEGGGKRREE